MSHLSQTCWKSILHSVWTSPAVWPGLVFTNRNVMEEGKHLTCLPFCLKGQQPEEHKNPSWGGCISVLRCECVSPSNKISSVSSVKRKQEAFSAWWVHSCLQRVCAVSERTNTQRDKRTDTSNCCHKMSPPLLLSLSPIHFSTCKRRPGSSFVFVSSRC